MATDPDIAPIFSTTVNSPNLPTILFLHGLGSSHLEFSYNQSYLPTYHLLLVDLPGQGKSSHLPLSTSTALIQLVSLINSNVPSKRVHVVGSSYGGMIALELGQHHPEVVESLFVTGFVPFRGMRLWAAQHPRVIYSLESSVSGLAQWLPGWMIGGPSVVEAVERRRKIGLKTASLEITQQGFEAIAGFAEEDVRAVTVRTLLVAGGRADDVETTRAMGRVMKNVNEASRAVVIRDGLHPWQLQFPELFADAVKAWIEGRSLPQEMKELS